MKRLNSLSVIAALAASISLSSCQQKVAGSRSMVEDRLTLAWQHAHCPRTEALYEIVLPNERVADVEIYQIFDDRLYVPRQWLRAGAYLEESRKPWRNGILARTGGAGSHEPWHGGGVGGLANPHCLGIVFHSIPPRSPSRDPRFVLSLALQRSSTNSVDGNPVDQEPGTPLKHQGLRIIYSEVGEPLNWTNPPVSTESPRIDIGDGWFTVARRGSTNPSNRRIAIDGAFSPSSLSSEAEFKAYEVLNGWRFSIRLADQVGAEYDLTNQVPVARWRDYRAPAREIYDWLKTKPMERDDERKFAF